MSVIGSPVSAVPVRRSMCCAEKPAVYVYAGCRTRRSHILWLQLVTMFPGAKERLADLLTDPARTRRRSLSASKAMPRADSKEASSTSSTEPFTTVDDVPIWVRNVRP